MIAPLCNFIVPMMLTGQNSASTPEVELLDNDDAFLLDNDDAQLLDNG